MKKFVKSIITISLSVTVCLLNGCGGREAEVSRTDSESVTPEDASTAWDTEDADAAGAYESAADDASDGGSDIDGWNGEVYKWSFEGDKCGVLNGNITSIRPSDTSRLIVGTADGSLYMLEPLIYFTQEDSEIKAYLITEDGGISDLDFAGQHMAYGNGRLVYFDMSQGYEETSMEDHLQAMEMESFSMPELVYSFEIVQQAELTGSRDLLLVTDDAAFCAYVNTDNRVCVDYRDSSGGTYTTYSDVVFEGDDERSDVAVSKSIFRFIMTQEQELLFIRKGNIAADYGGTVQAVSLSYVDLTDEIGAQVQDIYGLLNNTECCYVVDEEQNIYYVSADMGDEITVNKITQFDLGTITDIQGFAGTNEKMLIATADGAYYYYDDNSYVTTRKIDALDGSYQSVALLMESDMLALGDDGYLYVIENKN